jgi:L,D-transpeptidase YcbB
MVRPTTLRLGLGIVALTTVALCFALSFHLTRNSASRASQGAPERTAPSPAADPLRAALRKALPRLAGRADVAPADAQDLAGATAFYNAGTGPLLWVTGSGISERGNAVIGEIRKAGDWGMNVRDFALPQPPAKATPEAMAAAEIAVTVAVLKYARYARGGRFGDPSGISKVLDYGPRLRRPKDVLTEIAGSAAPDAYLRSLHPQHEQFEGLRRVLLKLRQTDAASNVEPGRENEDRTILLGRIIVNMERWRWLPADLGAFHVWNNVPEFVTRVVRKGEIIHSDRIVTGQPEWPTPAFSADMRTIVFHPSWVVPDGIKKKELLPRLRDSSQSGLVRLFTGKRSSRALLEQQKLQVYYQGRPVDPDQVDWSSANISAYDFRQPPGPTNVLGAIKFLFPNKHDVYMHDTPQRAFFARSYRGLSHGCMRVADPPRFAAVLLAQDKSWSEQEVGGLLNGGPREVQLTTPIPVHMTYFTATVDRQGTLQTFGDLYGLDTRMGEILFGANVPFVTPRYDDEIIATRARPAAPSGAQTLANALANIFSP